MTYDHHIIFVAPEITPNITPFTDSRFHAKRIYLIHTANFLDLANRLAHFYKQQGRETELIEIKNAFDMAEIQKGLQKIIDQHQNNLENLACNISCGTKLMGIAAALLFSKTSVGLYYILPNDELIWMNPNLPRMQLQDNIKLQHFLSLFGVTEIKERQPIATPLLERVTKDIEQKIIQSKSTSKLNHFSVLASWLFNPKTKIDIISKDDKQQFHQMVKNWIQSGLPLKKNNHQYLPQPNFTPEHRKLIQGEWFEFLVFSHIVALKKEIPQIQDVMWGTPIQTDNAFKDEIDVIFLANNKLFIIECKTGKSFDANLHIQRLDSLGNRLGGVFTRSALVTTKKIDRNGHYQKAQKLKVKIIDQDKLIHLKAELKDWIENTI